LRRLLPGLAEGATATDTIANAQRQAAGAADQYAASSEGQAARTTDAFGELAEELGGALLPILDALLPALLPIIAQLGELMRAVLPILIPLIESLAAGLKLGLGIWTGIANIVSQKVIPALTPVIALMQRLVDEILPVLTGLIQGLGDAFDTVAGFVQSAADAIGDIVQAAQDALGVIGDLLGELGKITDFELPDVVGGITDALPDLWSAPAPTPEAPQAGVRGSSRQAGRAGGSVQVNIIGDPMTIERTVVRALRTHYRRAGRFPAELGSVA
jgi:hypothetical protein